MEIYQGVLVLPETQLNDSLTVYEVKTNGHGYLRSVMMTIKVRILSSSSLKVGLYFSDESTGFLLDYSWRFLMSQCLVIHLKRFVHPAARVTNILRTNHR